MKIGLGAAGLAIALTGLAGCGGIREAHMAVPSELAAAERVTLDGMGGWHRGDFELAGAKGRFTRASEATGYHDGEWITRRGGGSFLYGELSGRCRFAEAELDFGLFQPKPRQLDYVCDFARGGEPIEARLTLRENNVALGGMTPQERREGIFEFEGRRIGLRSVHHSAESRIPTASPIGYLFEAGGRPVGGIDLNGGDHSLFLPRDPALREAAIAASLAVSVFWDPADDPDR